MKFLRTLVIGSVFFAATHAFAQAERYQTLQEAFKSGFYRVTCSSMEAIQTHVYAVAKKQTGRGPNNAVRLDDLKVISIDPAHSLNVTPFSLEQTRKLLVVESSNLKIAGMIPGNYYDGEFELEVQDSVQKNGSFAGKFYYTDNDGLTIDRKVQCGLTNYVLNSY